MSTEIIPAVLAKDFNELREHIARVMSVTRIIQIDVCDGRFVDSTSWPMSPYDRESCERILAEEEGLPYWDSLDFEFDLMVRNAHEQFDFFVRLGAKRIVFHLEAETNKEEFKEFLEGLDMYTKENLDIGLAINTTTPTEALAPFISHVDFVQCMGIEHIGHQGEPFDEKVLPQISALRKMYPELTISVDGSVNEDTAPLLVDAGADRLIVGSALLQSYDVRETMRNLKNL
jgi:ribulose-phosphate 3-epimerase